MQKASTIPCGGKIVYVVKEFAESMFRTVKQSYPKDVESVLGECTGLVEATHVNLPAYVDPSGRDAKYPQLTKTTDRKAGTDGQGDRESWRNDDRNEVQSANNDRVPPNLQSQVRMEEKGRSVIIYPEPNKLNGTGAEAQSGNPSEDNDETDRVSIKLEPDWLWKQHRPDKGTFGRIESCPAASAYSNLRGRHRHHLYERQNQGPVFRHCRQQRARHEDGRLGCQHK